MSSSEYEPADEVFRKLEAVLAELRTAASAPPDPPQSWTKRAFSPAPGSTRQREFNSLLVSALTGTLQSLRAIVSDQEARLEQISEGLAAVRTQTENLDAFCERSDRLEAQLRSAATNVNGLQERAAVLEAELAQTREELSAANSKLGDEMQERSKSSMDETRRGLEQSRDEIRNGLEQLRDEMREGLQQSRDEMRERIQHLLDEQRVCIRQLSLQASEQAVLADRARRATELKLEELSRPSGPPPP
jgi:chromosome segregation ATPase